MIGTLCVACDLDMYVGDSSLHSKIVQNFEWRFSVSLLNMIASFPLFTSYILVTVYALSLSKFKHA